MSSHNTALLKEIKKSLISSSRGDDHKHLFIYMPFHFARAVSTDTIITMPLLSEILRPYLYQFKWFDINFEYEPKSEVQWKRIFDFVHRSIIKIYFILLVIIAAFDIYFVAYTYGETRDLKHAAAEYDTTYLMWLTSGIVVLSNIFAFIYIYLNQNPANFKKLKSINLSDREAKQLNRKCHWLVTLPVALTLMGLIVKAVIQIGWVVRVFSGSQQLNDCSFMVEIIIIIIIYLVQFILYFQSFCCAIMTVVSEIVKSRMDANIKKLKSSKSSMRIDKMLTKVLMEYERLDKIAKTFDELFSPVILITALSHLMTVAVTIALSSYTTLNGVILFVFGEFYSYFNFVYFIIYILSAVKSNAMKNQIIKYYVLHLVSTLGSQIPIESTIERLNQSHQLIHVAYFKEQMFTMTTYVQIDEMLLLSLFLQIYDLQNGMATIPVKNEMSTSTAMFGSVSIKRKQ
ncbi:hypothetical protein CHUAL_008338 [Chamberlinius hualienensis]